MIDAAIFLAFASACLSWLDPSAHGSVANSSFVNAGHWVIIFLLIAARIHAVDYIKTDIEATWLLYGFMLGEVDTDMPTSMALMLLSAMAFQRHRRALRVHECDTTAPVASDDESAEF